MKKEYSGERFLPDECKGEMAIEHYQRYQFAKYLVENKTVLDVACGEGYGSSLLAENASKVVGMDIDKLVIAKANEKYGNSKLSFVEGNITQIPFEDNAFDVIISYETIEHVSEKIQKIFLSEIVRVLKQDGLLVMSTPNKAIYTDLVGGKNKFHIKEFYVEEFEDFLCKEFRNIEVFGQFPDTGYFIMHENEKVVCEKLCVDLGRSRYVIAVCSNKLLHYEVDTKQLLQFDDSMYYFLNLRVHELERLIQKEKVETDLFENKQKQTIDEQKTYIMHLENDIIEQKGYIDHLENDIIEQKGYIDHLENDIIEQKEYIAHLESDVSEQKGYITHLEKDITELKMFVENS